MDSFAYQEVMTPGHLFASVLKDALNNALSKIKLNYTNDLRITKAASEDPLKIVQSRKHFEVILSRVCNEISYSINYFISTGNIKTHQLDLQQLSGWTIVADRLNMNRFLSHFRAVHRGQFFMQMRTTEVLLKNFNTT
jgi:DNA-directed RNA polymerase I subunit RPA2